MNESDNRPLIIAFIAVVVLLLIFGGATMTGSLMNGGMMERGSIGGFSWIWIATLISLGHAVRLGWSVFGKNGVTDQNGHIDMLFGDKYR